MKLLFSFLIFWLSCTFANAQVNALEKIYAFKITGYITSLTDSSSVVQVIKPASLPLTIKEKQLGVLYHSYKLGATLDTAMVGRGRCQLIKGDYYYFAISHLKQNVPAEGDLVYILLKLPHVYNGLLLHVMNHAIEFNNVYGDPFLKTEAIFSNTKQAELNILDSMVNDIRFTGNTMKLQMPDQNQPISSGMYKGKNLFEAMEAINRSDLEAFFKYMTARPKKYAGNAWKISEIFATWMNSGAPTVVINF